MLNKINGKHLLWVFAGILPLVIFAAMMLVLFSQQQEKAMHRLLQETANNAAGTLDRTIGEQLTQLNSLAASRSLDEVDLAAFRIDAQRALQLHPDWQSIILTDQHKPIFSLSDTATTTLPLTRDPVSLLKVWITKQPYVENLVNGTVAIRVPVLRDQSIRNTLVVTLDPRVYLNRIKMPNSPQSWGFLIIGEDQVVIAATENAPAATGGRLPPELRHKLVKTFLWQNNLYAGPVHLGFGNWNVFVFAPAASIEASFLHKRLVVITSGVGALLLTGILIVSLSMAWASTRETTRLRQEIVDRKQAEHALSISEQRFRLVVEHAPEAIFIQANGRFAYLNASAISLFGAHSAEQLLGKPVEDRFHLETRPTLQRYLHLLNEQRVPFVQHKFLCLGTEDQTVHIEASAVPFEYDGTGGGLFFLRDMTAALEAESREKDLESQLRLAQKMEAVGRLAGGVAHDYNNMLSVIVGYTQLAMEAAPAETPINEYLQQVYDAALRSTEITRQLLAFARKQTITPVILDLNEKVEGLLKMLGRLIGEDITLHWNPKPDLWPIKIDPTQVDQILANLCVNARDAISGVGDITIETDKVTFDAAYCDLHAGFNPGDYVLLAVSDDGCGMDHDTIEHIFEPFFTTKKIGQGTGLGLATVYGIIKQNNGFINVYSEPDKGTTFRIYFARHGEAAAEEKVGHCPESYPLGNGETILVVEDEQAILELTQTILLKLGYTVLAAALPSTALLLAEEHHGPIDLLMTDVVMPEMNGKELATRLLTKHPDIKVLFTSGYTANVIAHQGVLDSGVNFLPKPFPVEVLAVKIAEVLHG